MPSVYIFVLGRMQKCKQISAVLQMNSRRKHGENRRIRSVSNSLLCVRIYMVSYIHISMVMQGILYSHSFQALIYYLYFLYLILSLRCFLKPETPRMVVCMYRYC